jgi:hypothetical protein
MPEFECRRELTLPAPADAVWAAVATSDGNAGWLFPNPIDASGPGTTWEPPHHFGARIEQHDWFNDVQFQIEDRGDGTSALRYSHKGVFPADGFELQETGVQQHTDFYLHTLAQYLEHFRGRTASYIGEVPGGIQGPAGSATAAALGRLQLELGFGDGARVGDRVALSPDGAEGTIDYLSANFTGVRTPEALYRFFGRGAFGAPLAVVIHAFDGRDPEAANARWANYLAQTFA